MDDRSKWGVKIMDVTSTFEAYMLFRMSEAEHIAKNYPTSDTGWVYSSSNTEYERFTMDAYDASLKTNSGAW